MSSACNGATPTIVSPLPAALAIAGAIAKVSRPDGKQFTFYRAGTAWTAERDVADQLLPVVDSNNMLVGWRYVTTTDDVESYDADGKLRSITARNGMMQTLAYSDNSTQACRSRDC